MIYDIEYRYRICLLVLLFIIDIWHIISILDLSAGTLIITLFPSYFTVLCIALFGRINILNECIRIQIAQVCSILWRHLWLDVRRLRTDY